MTQISRGTSRIPGQMAEHGGNC